MKGLLNRPTKSLVFIAALILLFGACDRTPKTSSPSGPTHSPKLKVVATFSILGDFVQNIAGDRVALHTLVGPDNDTHDFEPAPSDNTLLAQADIVVENGLGLESWLDNLYRASQSTAIRIVASSNIETHPNGRTQDNPDVDPHIWQDPQRAIQMVRTIEAALSVADTANAAVYKRNAAGYIQQLEKLDIDLKQVLEAVPVGKRRIVTSHDALGYFADRYHIELVGSVITSLSTENGEPSAQDFAKLIDAIIATNTKAIFLETITNPALVERVSKEAGIKVGPALYTDALGASGSAGATYIDAMRHNAQSIAGALR